MYNVKCCCPGRGSLIVVVFDSESLGTYLFIDSHEQTISVSPSCNLRVCRCCWHILLCLPFCLVFAFGLGCHRIWAWETFKVRHLAMHAVIDYWAMQAAFVLEGLLLLNENEFARFIHHKILQSP